MAGKKKTKKPAANPARGFATTSIAAKPRVDTVDSADETAGSLKNDAAPVATNNAQSAAKGKDVVTGVDGSNNGAEKTLSPEEFEKQLEESELQLLVEKYAQKVKRDVQRQKVRLETDRRVLRGQAETVNTKKWLPPELMDHVLDLIKAESRFAASSTSSELASGGKILQEEDLTIKMWTLEQTLAASGFHGDKIQSVLQFVLDIAPNVSTSNKESIWGLDEALEWLARECGKEDLPEYDGRGKPGPKSLAGSRTSTISPISLG